MLLIGAKLVNQALSQLNEWEDTVMLFCIKYNYEVWLNNLQNMISLLKKAES